MQDRFTIKIAGAAGQGIKSSGLIIAKSLKRSGFYTFGYTEYPSLIRGGHNVFQIEVSDHPLGAISKDTDVLLAMNKDAIDFHINEFDQDSGIMIIDAMQTLTDEQKALAEKYKIRVFSLPLLDLATTAGGNALMKNTVTLGAVWKTLGLPITILEQVVAETFDKTPEMIAANKKAVNAGYEAINEEFTGFTSLFKPVLTDEQKKESLIISGNESLCLGAIAAGVKIYSSYPMTPASSILTTFAKWAKQSGMLVKQAEDEITAAQMCIGANFAGTRALCGTSGGGVDLMSESISLAGMTETPFVVILGQRHGAATGGPTWTGQGELNMAINTSHGEFPRIVLSVSDPEDAFYLIGQAFNLAEKFQVPVLLLTEKYIAESFYTVGGFDQTKVVIDRGEIISKDKLNGQELRYKVTESGVSPRWFPGQHSDNPTSKVNSTFISNSDEHDEKGYSTEDDKVTKIMADKRMRKVQTILNALPEPEVAGDLNADLIFVTWGSNKNILQDAKVILEKEGKKVTIINFSYLWPLKTETLKQLDKVKDKVFVVEQNFQSQLAELIKKETGINFTNRITRYDSKPFYLEDILEAVKK